MPWSATTDRGGRPETYPSVMIHGGDTTVPGHGKISVQGVQEKWTDDQGRLHLSDDKKAGSDPMGGFDGFF